MEPQQRAILLVVSIFQTLTFVDGETKAQVTHCGCTVQLHIQHSIQKSLDVPELEAVAAWRTQKFV